jgi:Tfp pilus assembly protein PilO
MRPLTQSERRLIFIFLGLVFIVLNVFIWVQLSKKRSALLGEISRYRQEQREAGAWLQDKDLWSTRKGWLDEKQPVSQADGQESARLLEALQQSARQQNIIIASQRLVEPRPQEHYLEVAVQLEIKGTFEAVSKWLAGLQDPEKFQAVTSLTLKSDAEPPRVICTLTVARWMALAGEKP